ncbi:hypothetical protein [Pantoea sp. BAV 3049]|uniref:hypothetical protein n=1 Tax=Pantoea sp. BAV 3049 TaxID=2654188 RepID=UPI00131BD7B2|nr:hypothetical protein [Pantoea sp. BAV 3049]
MNVRLWALVAAAVLAAGWGYGHTRYLAGWYAHSEKVNAAAEQKKGRAAAAVQVTEAAAAAASAGGRVVYRTVYRDVVKYVNNPARTVCQFDPDAVQLRQRAIDAANHIPGFDAAAVPDK